MSYEPWNTPSVFHIFCRAQEDFVGLSFTTISSVGPNAAIIHYKPSLETDARITTDDVYLCDSGGQYK